MKTLSKDEMKKIAGGEPPYLRCLRNCWGAYNICMADIGDPVYCGDKQDECINDC